ncbi:MAG: terminase family protein, partial [Clostridia bacterium]|nr:terminase family protein [Clostridia bacterium]
MENIVETLRKLKTVEAELARRKENDFLSKYNTGEKRHEKQIAFHKCQKRNRWVFGGNRSGKTECGAVESVYMARGVHPYRENRKDVLGWVVSLSQQVQRDVAQKKILRYLRRDWIEEIVMLTGRKDAPESGVIDFIRVKNVFGGSSVIGFKSCDQGREKFQGASLDFVWFDEEPPEDIYIECRMRVLDRKGDIFATMTPLKGLTFVYNEIFLNRNADPEVWYEFIDWSDNPYLDEEETRVMEGCLDERTLQSRKYGRFGASEGLVYPEFDESIHVIEPFAIPKEWQDNISIDPGLNNPLSAHWYAVDFDDNVYVVYEHYEAG